MVGRASSGRPRHGLAERTLRASALWRTDGMDARVAVGAQIALYRTARIWTANSGGNGATAAERTLRSWCWFMKALLAVLFVL